PRLPRQALRRRRRAAAARAASRLEGDLFTGRARCVGRTRAARAARSGRPSPGALPGERRRQAARPAPGRRPRDLPRRRPAREDGPGEHGALTRGPRPVPRSRSRRARARAADAAQGTWASQEAPPPPGGRAAPPAFDRPRTEAGILDPGRRVAARRARAVRPRGAVSGHGPTPGILPAAGGHPVDRRPRLGPRGSLTAALGAALVRVLARALGQGSRARVLSASLDRHDSAGTRAGVHAADPDPPGAR